MLYIDAETGFVYLRARFYDPATGQFLSRDPLVALTASAYGYVGGNPLNGTDPTGLLCVTFLDSNCQSFAQQHAKGAQQVANVAGGIVQGIGLTNGDLLVKALGQGSKVQWNATETQYGQIIGL